MGPRDYEFLFTLLSSPEMLVRWRFRGATPSPEVMPQVLWQNVLTQFLLVGQERSTPIGIVSAYNADFRCGTVYLSMLVAPEAQSLGRPIEGAAFFLDYIFEVWNLRKVYLEVAEFNLDQIGSAVGRVFDEEGGLRRHEYHAGKYWDLVVLALYREKWAELAERMKPATPSSTL